MTECLGTRGHEKRGAKCHEYVGEMDTNAGRHNVGNPRRRHKKREMECVFPEIDISSPEIDISSPFFCVSSLEIHTRSHTLCVYVCVCVCVCVCVTHLEAGGDEAGSCTVLFVLLLACAHVCVGFG